jgi:Lhr-like helicase
MRRTRACAGASPSATSTGATSTGWSATSRAAARRWSATTRRSSANSAIDAAGCLALPAPRIARDFYQNIGTIASESMVTVRLGRRNLGQVEESFMKGLRPGDLFVLNGRTVRLVETRLLTAKVTEAAGALPTVPRWNANKMPLASGLAAAVVRLRSELAHLLDPGAERGPLTERLGAGQTSGCRNGTGCRRPTRPRSRGTSPSRRRFR